MIPDFARFVQSELKTGWFYRILEPGVIRKTDTIQLQERPHLELNIRQCVDALLVNYHPDILDRMSKNMVLSPNWREPAQEALTNGFLPDGRLRLGE